MKKYSLALFIACLYGIAPISAQSQRDQDMTSYRIRNNGGGISGWNARDGLGPAINVHSTGASIGRGDGPVAGWVPQDGLGPAINVHSTGATIGRGDGPVAGWVPQDGLGPAINVHSTGATIGRSDGPVAGWVPQDGLGPAINVQHSNNNWNNNSGSSWGNGNNQSYPNWGGGHTTINPLTSWNNPIVNSGWQNAGWSNPGWGNPLWNNPGSPVIINNYYNPGYWWRDVRYAPSYAPMSWGGNNYYYHDGNFFNIVNGIYQVVLPVLGMILQSIPAGATQLGSYNNIYSYHGVFYQYTGNGYRVVAPPVGACLTSLPYFAKPVTINGISCYKYDNVYIEPVYNNVDGDYCYRVIANVY